MDERRKFGKHRGRGVNQAELETFLADLGFKAEQVKKHNLNILAWGSFDNQAAIFKLSTTQDNSPRVQNEFNWNDAIHQIPQEAHPSFRIPCNFQGGYYNQLFYFIAERFEGEPLSQGDPITHIKQRLPLLAKTTFEIKNLSLPSGCEFVKAKASKNLRPIGHSLLAAAVEWSAQVPRNLGRFLRILEDNKDSLQTSPGHGGFELGHMFDASGRIGLIDGELAGLKGALYYDVAFFYIRVRNDFDAPEAARQYLTSFRELLTPADQHTFWEEIKPVMITRYLGDLWGADKNEQRLDKLEPLGKDILENKVLY